MHRRRRHHLILAVALVSGLAMIPGTDVIAQEPHPEGPGHLPPGSENVDLVSKLRLTNVAGGIADVGYFNGFAYLNAFNPECAGRPGAQGTGVHVVDVRDARNPEKVGFLAAESNSYVGEGISVVRFERRDILVHNNETCNSNNPVVSGVSVWDVTNPLAPVKLGQFGDTTPAVANQTFHTTHSVQAFTQPGKIFALLQDNQETKDVDILDLTAVVRGTGGAVMASESGLEDWPGAQGDYANGDTVFHHDSQFKRFGGNDYLLVSYWDAGQVLLNVDDPYSPVFVTDSDFRRPDPLMPAFEIPEGNSHQSYFSSNNKWILSSDEDFGPYRTLCEISGLGATGCGEFGFSVPMAENFPDGFSGSTVFGGSGCEEDLNGNGISDRAEVPTAAATGADAVVFTRGVCFFSIKIESGQIAGYDMVIVANHHTGARAGLIPDAFLCGGQGHEYTKTASAICIGHRASHQLFNDPPEYTPSDAANPGFDVVPIGTAGADISAEGGVFDGWGYVQLHDATDPNLRITDSYAVPEALDPAFVAPPDEEDHGILSVHEVKTDPRRDVNLAYFSYYNAGFRVAEFGKSGVNELGFFIDEGGNHFWGIFPIGDEFAGHGYSPDHGQTQLAISALQEFLDANAGTPAADKVEDALAKSQTALAELSKDPVDRQSAAGAIEGAIGDLESAVASGLLSPADGNELMGILADVARGFVQDAANEPIVGAGDPAKVSEGEDLRNQGDALRAAGAFKDAAAKYKDAVAKTESGRGRGVRPLILGSDRDSGLYIFDYTGKRPKKD